MFFIEITHQQWINDYAVDTGEVTLLDAKQSEAVLDAESVDTIEQFLKYGYGDLSSDFGDGLAYSAQDAGWTEIYGPFYVRFQHHDEEEVKQTLTKYLADRQERGVPEDGDGRLIRDHSVKSKIEQINRLIASLPPEEQIVFLAIDRSWGDAHDLLIKRVADLNDEDREYCQIED